MTPNQFVELGRCDAFQEVVGLIRERAILKFGQNDLEGAELFGSLADDLHVMGMERRALLDANVRDSTLSDT